MTFAVDWKQQLSIYLRQADSCSFHGQRILHFWSVGASYKIYFPTQRCIESWKCMMGLCVWLNLQQNLALKAACWHWVQFQFITFWGVTGWLCLERWTGDPKVEGSNPARSTKKTLSFAESKRLCWLAVGVPNPGVYTHAYDRPCTTLQIL